MAARCGPKNHLPAHVHGGKYCANGYFGSAVMPLRHVVHGFHFFCLTLLGLSLTRESGSQVTRNDVLDDITSATTPQGPGGLDNLILPFIR